MAAKTRRALGSSPAGRRAKTFIAQRAAAKINVADPTLRAVLSSITSAVPDEVAWQDRIEAKRRQLQASNESVVFEIENPDWWREAIARSTFRRPPVLLSETQVERSVGEITDQTSKQPEWGRFFFRILRQLRPDHCLELGTSVGISGCYIAAALEANSKGHLITMEGVAGSARVAEGAFADLGLAKRVEVVVGWFSEQLPAVLACLPKIDLAFIDGHHEYQPTKDYFSAIVPKTSPGGLLIFDDVNYYSGRMREAWDEIKTDPRVTGSLTIGPVGFAVIDGQPAGHHTIPKLGLT